MTIVAVVTVAGTMTSCNNKSGTNLYEIDMKDFDDNMDILKDAIESDFEKLGFSKVSDHVFALEGEVSSCNKQAAQVFQQCC